MNNNNNNSKLGEINWNNTLNSSTNDPNTN